MSALDDYRASLAANGRALIWRGKRVDELTHEELLRAYSDLAKRLEEERRFTKANLEVEREIELTRRSLQRRTHVPALGDARA